MNKSILITLSLLIFIVLISGCTNTSNNTSTSSEDVRPSGSVFIGDLRNGEIQQVQVNIENIGNTNYQTVEIMFIGYDSSGNKVGEKNVTIYSLDAYKDKVVSDHMQSNSTEKITRVEVKIINKVKA